MTKKLKIRFVKFEKALTMQILEQTGEFKETDYVHISVAPELSPVWVYLRGNNKHYDFRCDTCPFNSNAERDEYLAKVVNWITDEQFTTKGELKVGEMCEVRDCATEYWKSRKLLAILPENCGDRYIFASESTGQGWVCARYARPLAQRVEPKIDGDIYTWEMEVADER